MNKVEITLRLFPEKYGEFVQTVRLLEREMTEQTGFRKANLYQGVNDQYVFGLIIEWETQDDLERYLGAENFRILLGALKVLCQTAEINCAHIGEQFSDIACSTYEPFKNRGII